MIVDFWVATHKVNNPSQTSDQTTHGGDGRRPVFLQLADEIAPVVVIDLVVDPCVAQPLKIEVRRQEQ